MPSRILSIPFALAALVILYLMLMHHRIDLAWVLLMLIFAFTIIYVLGPQINWMWYKRHPKRLPAGLKGFMSEKMPFYAALSPQSTQRFDNRLSLAMLSYDFKPMGFEKMPEDIKVIILSNSIRLTLGLPEYRFKKFEHIVVYPHPFPSPQYPDDLHTSELFEQDGVLIFSAEQIMQHIFNPNLIFNIVLYEWTRVLMLQNQELAALPLTDEHWPLLAAISGIPKEKVMTTIGLQHVDVRAVAVTYFFIFPERFRQGLPETYRVISNVLNQNPDHYPDPVVDYVAGGPEY